MGREIESRQGIAWCLSVKEIKYHKRPSSSVLLKTVSQTFIAFAATGHNCANIVFEKKCPRCRR
jgi:hypothetical protein